ncbi:hypothetical protein [Thalassotalea sp. SU-HH00458]|uniref:hypothetical protein n=1 Tax=Thalassotalea sp. SU-HH00458 TaxID=3127657 RepID=UPI003104D62B
MRETCSSCQESFLTEHIHHCECGRDLCFRCIQIHKQGDCAKNTNKIVHPTDSMQNVFSQDFLHKLDSHIEYLYKIVYVWSEATNQSITSGVSFKSGLAIGESFTISLEVDEFKQLLQVHDGNNQEILSAYIQKVKSTVSKKLEQFEKNKLKKSHSTANSNTYSFGYTPDEANEMSAFFDGLSNDDKTLVKTAYRKNNIRSISGFIEYIKQHKVK